MILSPIDLPTLPGLLARFDAVLFDQPLASAVFRRIAEGLSVIEADDLALSTDPVHHAQALTLLRDFGMGIIDGLPQDGFTWDGHAVRVDMEPSVIIHEVAHLQVCAPERRTVLDFGLGAGPETGIRDAADGVQTVHGVRADLEEALASLLGILWEVELGQPGLLAFLEQNWLEGGASPTNKAHFVKIAGHLHAHGLIDDDGRPTRILRNSTDAEFLDVLLVG